MKKLQFTRPLRTASVLFTLGLFALGALGPSARAQTTYNDTFTTANDYLTNGVLGTLWDGVYMGTNFGTPFVGQAAGGASFGFATKFDSATSTNGTLSIIAGGTDWEGGGDDGLFLWKVAAGDFSAYVNIVTPFNNAGFNNPGLMVRLFGANGVRAGAGNTESWVSLTRFNEFGYGQYLRTEFDGALSQINPNTGVGVNNTNYWIRIDRTGDTLTFLESSNATDWVSIGSPPSVALPSAWTGKPVQVGLIHASYESATPPPGRAMQFSNFNLTVNGTTAGTVPGAPVITALTTNAGQINLTLTKGATADGTLILAWQRSVPVGNALVLAQPTDGITYNAGDPLPYNGVNVGADSTTTSATISQLFNGRYFLAAFSYKGSGSTRTYSHAAFVTNTFVSATVTNIVMSTPAPPIVVGGARQLKVIGQYDSGADQDVTASCLYTSSAPTIAGLMGGRPGRFASTNQGSASFVAVFPNQQNYTNELTAFGFTSTNIVGLKLRQSVVTRSLGISSTVPSGAPANTYGINSFFDVYLEASTNGGSTWSAPAGPYRLTMANSTRTYTDFISLPRIPASSGSTYTSSVPNQLLTFDNNVIISNVTVTTFGTTPNAPPSGSGILTAYTPTMTLSITTNSDQSRFKAATNTSQTVSIGLTNISTVNYFQSSQSVTVVPATMTHLYVWNDPTDTGVTATDRVGTADGTITSPFINPVDGSLLFDGSAVFGTLPPSLFTNYGGWTIELFVKNAATPAGGRFFSFGTAATEMEIDPNNNAFQSRARFINGANNAQVLVPLLAPDASTLHQFVMTVAGASNTAAFWIDGVQLNSNVNFTITPEDLGLTTGNYLGRNQGGGGLMNGAYYSLRTFNGPITPLQIAVDAAAGPTVTNFTPGTLTSLSLTVTTPMNQFDTFQCQVIGQYTGQANVPLTSVPSVIQYITNSGNIIYVDAVGNVTGNAAGTVTLIATNPGSGLSDSKSITVIAVSTTLTHRWSFSEGSVAPGGTTAESIGGYFGTLIASTANAAAYDPSTVSVHDGQAWFHGDTGGATTDSTGGQQGYIQLQNGIFDGYNQITIETWYTEWVAQQWSRIFDLGVNATFSIFGCTFGPNGERVSITTTGSTAEQQVNYTRLSPFVEHHLVYTIEAGPTTSKMYVDGTLVNVNTNNSLRPKNIPNTTAAFLGKSQYGDNNFNGSINEFRIWNGPLTADQALIDFSFGPDSPVGAGTNSINWGGLSSASVSVPSVPAGTFLPAKLLATFTGPALPNINITAFASNWTSSASARATVDQFGLVHGVSAGSATISATFNGVTYTGTATVTTPAPAMIHHYTFNSDYSDSGTTPAAAATPFGAVFLSGNAVQLPGTNSLAGFNAGTNWGSPWTNGSFVQLPPNLLGGLHDVTIETWATSDVLTNGGGSLPLWNFGAGTNGVGYRWGIGTNANAQQGTVENLQFTPFNSATIPNASLTYNFRGPGSTLTFPGSFAGTNLGDLNQFVVVISGTQQKYELYVNGKLQNSYSAGPRGLAKYLPVNPLTNPAPIAPIVFGFDPAYLTNLVGNIGHAMRALGNNNANGGGFDFKGSVADFRVYNGALDKLQVAASFAAGAESATINPGACTAITNILPDATMVISNTQDPKVIGTFASAGVVDLSDYPQVQLVSGDTTKVVVTGDGRVKAVGTGSTTVTATYGGQSSIANVTVVAAPASPLLTHRYPFTTDARDLIGKAAGTLMGNANVSGHKVFLDGTCIPETYVNLPSDLISGYPAVTLEAWFASTNGNDTTNARLLDFGDNLNQSLNYLSFAANSGAANAAGIFNGQFQGDQTAINNTALTNGAATHMAVVLDSSSPTTNTLSLYTNGVLAQTIGRGNNPGAQTNSLNLRSLVDHINFIGRTMNTSFRYYRGSVDEVRVYYGALSASQVANSFASGPNGTDGMTVSVSGSTVTISWPATEVSALATLETSPTIVPSPVTWTAIGSPPYTLVGNRYQVTEALGAAPKYYKLLGVQ